MGPERPGGAPDTQRPLPVSTFKSRGGVARLAAALRYSASGLRDAWKHEAAFRQEVLVGVPLMIAAPWLARDRWQALLLIGVVVLVWLVELLNSAIEAVADALTLERHPLIGRAKDLGSAAVMLALLLAAAVWTTVLW